MSTAIQTQAISDDIKLSGFSTVGEALSFAQLLIDSKLIPSTLKTPDAVVAVILQGRELGFGPITSVNNINNIQGKPTLGVHAIAAKLAQAGLTYQLIKDYEPETKTDAEGKETIVDRVTTFRFFRMWNGRVIENDVSYRWSEATKAGYTTKDNWVKMPRIMMRTRALTVGARLVAPEAILGLYETSELADAKDVNYSVTEEGEVTVIDN
jgi:hypothetical protein